MLKLITFMNFLHDENFSEVRPRQIFDLGKQFNLIIRLQNVLKTSLQEVLKMS